MYSKNLHPDPPTFSFVLFGADRTEKGLLDKPPASSAFLPSRASSCTRLPTLLAPQRWYEAIRVWSHTTFIVYEAAIKGNLAVET
jgi:hypothetical protein